MSTAELEMFRPPINRAMRALDRSFFKKTIPLSAARIFDLKQIPKVRAELGRDLLHLDRLPSVQTVEISPGHEAKALLLRADIVKEDISTWSPKLSELVQASQVDVIPFILKLDYDYWNYHDIMSSIIPENEQEELPTGFSVVGHVAHLNLREQYHPHKKLIAEVLKDKNPVVRTVINKTDEVGTENEYRTFSYELLAGEDDMNVEVNEENCIFQFDYAKVYWNSRLNTEHRRLVEMFKPGQAICDVMAGVGPFSIPAGKKRCFVWANDLNPDSFKSLEAAVVRNKVRQFVRPFNVDGRSFIRTATQQLLATTDSVDISSPRSRHNKESPKPIFIHSPRTFTHYILNLPASALTFLPAFKGLYSSHAGLFAPHTAVKLPMIHVHCFSTKSDDNKEEGIKICKIISEQIGHEMKPGNPENEGEVLVWDVRDVAPLKRMFCASFRLPEKVAFAQRSQNTQEGK